MSKLNWNDFDKVTVIQMRLRDCIKDLDDLLRATLPQTDTKTDGHTDGLAASVESEPISKVDNCEHNNGAYSHFTVNDGKIIGRWEECNNCGEKLSVSEMGPEG